MSNKLWQTVVWILFLLIIRLNYCKSSTRIVLNENISQLTIQSAGYPLINCLTGGVHSSWYISTALPRHLIELTCDKLVLDQGCKRGTFTVHDGKTLRRFCDAKQSINIKSINSIMMVEFRLNRCAVGSVKCLVKSVSKNEQIIDSSLNAGKFDSSEYYDTTPGGNKITSCSCGWRNKVRIVGGKETRVNEYPLMVSLITRNTGERICGGSIVTQYHILTAAHCIIGRMWTPLTVVVGEHDFTTAYETDATDKYNVEYFTQHEDFSPRTLENDIAIAVLNRAIKFNRFVGPACLPVERSVVDNDYVTALGWGYTSTTLNIASDVLRYVNLRVVNTKSCALQYNTMRSNTKSQFCTYARNKDTCQGDSGGPLLKLDTDTGRYTQYGIVSYGKTCASQVPAVNTDVNYYRNWIRSTVARHPSNVDICHKL